MRQWVLGLISLLTAISLLSPPSALAAEPFAEGWQAKPLVDSATPSTDTTTIPAASDAVRPAVQPAEPRLEEVLKPAVPFIESVEARLYLQSKKDEPLANRLNHIQTVLFGEVKYHDAGELLAKMAELFPQEAAKARADLLAQMKNNMPPAQKAAQGAPQTAVQPPQQTAATPIQTYPPADPKALKKKKDSFWGDDDDFFNDDDWDREFSQSQASAPRPRGSGLANLGTGLMNLATIAGSLAGTYYLNKNLGSNSPVYRDPYGSPYYYNGYGYPYSGYGTNGYGYGTPYNYRYYPQPYYGSGYGMPMTPYGTYYRRNSGISGLGVPY